MHSLKESIMSLLNKKIIAVFLIIQLSIAFFSIIEWIIIKDNGNQFMSTIKRRVDINNLYINIQETFPPNAIEKKISYIDNFMDFLENNDKIEEIGNYLPTGFMIKETSNVDYDRLDNKLNVFYNGMYSDARLYIDTIGLDQKSFEFFEVPISYGRKFRKEDYDDSAKDTIIFGDGLKEFYSVGDKIKLNDDIEYEIIGFLPQGYTFGSSGEGISRLNNMDMSCMKTMKEKDKKSNIQRCLMFTTTIMKPKSDTTIQELCKEVNEKAKELGLSTKTDKISNVVKDNIESLEDNVLHLLIVSVIIIVFSVISIVFTMVNYIVRRKREFGIRLACGSSIYNIIKLIVLENVVLFFISGLIALGCYYKKYHFSGNINNISVHFDHLSISLPVIMYFAIFIFIICMLACIIPIIKIKRLSPKELIGGVE